MPGQTLRRCLVPWNTSGDWQFALGAVGFSCVLHQRHKAEVHMELHVAVEEREAWVIRDKIDFSTLTAWNIDRVLANSCGCFSSDARQFKSMAMKMNRVTTACREE